MSEQIYCPGCGENVEPFVVIEKGDEIIKCSVCGLNLTESMDSQLKLQTVLLAEDSKLLREMAQEIFIKKGLTDDIQVFEEGETLIEAYIKCLTDFKTVSLFVLDIRMPNVNGLEAGLALRNVEKDFNVQSPVPILFFSAIKADNELRTVLNRLTPAAYVNKGQESRPDILAERLYQVILRLFGKRE